MVLVVVSAPVARPIILLHRRRPAVVVVVKCRQAVVGQTVGGITAAALAGRRRIPRRHLVRLGMVLVYRGNIGTAQIVSAAQARHRRQEVRGA